MLTFEKVTEKNEEDLQNNPNVHHQENNKLQNKGEQENQTGDYRELGKAREEEILHSNYSEKTPPFGQRQMGQAS